VLKVEEDDGEIDYVVYIREETTLT
jgi:hypothetical protein